MMVYEIKQLITEGRLEAALRKLLDYLDASRNYPDIESNTMALSSRYHRINRQHNNGQLSADEYDRSVNKMVSTLLGLVHDLEDKENYNIGRLSPDPIKKQPYSMAPPSLLKPLPFNDWLEMRGVKGKLAGRGWVLQEIKKWLWDDKGKRFFVIKGSLGVGKTAILHHVIEHFPEVIGYHYCISEFKKLRDPDELTLSVAAQLSGKFEGIAEPAISQRIYETIKSGVEHNLTLSKLISEPLSREEHPLFPRLLIIDAINEGFNPDHERDIVSLIKMWGRDLPSWVRILISYAYHPEIEDKFSEFYPEEIDLTHDSRSKGDIREYIKDTLIRDEKTFQGVFFTKAIIEKIVKRSDNNILLTKLLLKAVANQSISLTDELQYPRELSGIFNEQFRRLFSSVEYETQMRPILEVISASSHPLTAEELAGVLEMDVLKVQIELQKINAYVINRNGKYHIFHNSFAAWLQGKLGQDRTYTVNLRTGHTKISEYLLQGFKMGQPNAKLLYKSLIYHLLGSQRIDDIIDIMGNIEFLQQKLDSAGVNSLQDDYYLLLEQLPEAELKSLGDRLFDLFDQIGRDALNFYKNREIEQLEANRKQYFIAILALFFFVFITVFALFYFTQSKIRGKIASLGGHLLERYKVRIEREYNLLEKFVDQYSDLSLTMERLDQLMSYTTFFFSEFHREQKDFTALYKEATDVAYSSFFKMNMLKIKCLKKNKSILDVAFQYNFLAHFSNEIEKDAMEYYERSGEYYLQVAQMSEDEEELFKDKVIQARQIRNAGWNFLSSGNLSKCVEAFQKAKEKLELIPGDYDYVRLRKAELDLRCFQLILKFIEDDNVEGTNELANSMKQFFRSFWSNYRTNHPNSNYPFYLIKRLQRYDKVLGTDFLEEMKKLAKPIPQLNTIEGAKRILVISNQWDYWLADIVVEKLARVYPEAFIKVVEPEKFEAEERELNPFMNIFFGGTKAPFTGHLVTRIFHRAPDLIYLQERLEGGFGGVWQKVYKSKWYVLIAGNDEETIDGTIFFLRRPGKLEEYYDSILINGSYFKHLDE